MREKKLSAMFFNELKIPCKIQAQTISILEKKVNKIAQNSHKTGMFPALPLMFCFTKISKDTVVSGTAWAHLKAT